MSRPPDLVQGTLDLLILKILALEPMNGHAIGQRLQQVSGDILKVSDGSLYPALHKLEQEGWLVATWKVTEKKRRAKYYALSRLRPHPAGQGDRELDAALRRHHADRAAHPGLIEPVLDGRTFPCSIAPPTCSDSAGAR